LKVCFRRGWANYHSDDEDETAELQRELEKIKRERAEKREQEVR
jgi:protein CWC15